MRVQGVREPKKQPFRPLHWLGEDRARYTYWESWETGGGTATMPEWFEKRVVFEFAVFWVGGRALVDWGADVVSIDGEPPSPSESLSWRIRWIEDIAVRARLLIQEESDKAEEEKREDCNGDDDF